MCTSSKPTRDLAPLQVLDEFRELIKGLKVVKSANPSENAGEPATAKKPGQL